ncbi:hypothetical protein ACFC58_27225 [Kitasatospora purpeofusca]|uniref:hypothetical protein n=1 Tax=Kitasatospora purpeofusca TaxID=67352 RepID=UPI0035DEF6FD
MQPSAPVATRSAPAFPVAEAQTLAVRFARAYLSWDEADPDRRGETLRLMVPTGGDSNMGWDGHGRQEVLDVVPGAVVVDEQGQARARVEVLIRNAAAATGAAAPMPLRVALEIPVAESAGRVGVAGQPGLVGLSPLAVRPAFPAGQVDVALSTTTQPVAEAFFKAYAAGRAYTASVAAPNAAIPPLTLGIEFRGLTAWAVEQGSGNDRTATVRVYWQMIGGAVLEQTYRVKLTLVADSDGGSWKVAGVHGGATL